MYVFTGLFIKSLEEIENKKVSINIKNEDIKLDNLQSLINDKEKIKTYKYKDLSDDEWKEYFNRIKSTLISSRGCGRFLGLARLLIPNFACTP